MKTPCNFCSSGFFWVIVLSTALFQQLLPCKQNGQFCVNQVPSRIFPQCCLCFVSPTVQPVWIVPLLLFQLWAALFSHGIFLVILKDVSKSMNPTNVWWTFMNFDVFFLPRQICNIFQTVPKKHVVMLKMSEFCRLKAWGWTVGWTTSRVHIAAFWLWQGSCSKGAKVTKGFQSFLSQLRCIFAFLPTSLLF